MRVKKLIKVGLSEGGGVQRDFPLKEGGGGLAGGGGGGGGTYNKCYYEKKTLCWHVCLERIPGFICFLFKSFGERGNKV